MTGTQHKQKHLGDLCQFLKGVGPAKGQRIMRLGIETVNDLLTHFPRKYYDRRKLAKIADLVPGEEATFSGRVLTIAQRRPGRGRGFVTAAIGDESGIVQVVWFNQPYLGRHLKAGTPVVVSGELAYFRGQRQVVNPEFDVASDDDDAGLLSVGRIVPVYPLAQGVSQRFLRELIARTLGDYESSVVENLPASVVVKEGLVGRYDALRDIHFPSDDDAFDRAKKRLKFEELFYMQLILSLQRRRRIDLPNRPRINVAFDLEKKFIDSLPFKLTGAQSRVISEIHEDLSTSKGMHRLVQGDVGSGKTIVAGTALLAAVEAGMQAAMMVPTEILALQHARTLRPFFDSVGVTMEMLIGSLKVAAKRRIHAGLADGSISVAVGTHALIQDAVQFKDLAVVVIDEQHRFGVRQRAALVDQKRSPHMLVMTATPIPRTLALTAYADLDLSTIDEMPPGRKPVKTHIVGPDKRDGMYGFVRDEIAKGRQAYFLYPVIEETEKVDLEAATTAYEELAKQVFHDIPMGLLHGRMSFDEKEAVMKMFGSGLTKLLVTTTVIEVGVHVPQATIMVVHHPERFGLSQLHQLRGRVGRGGDAGYCFLLSGERGGMVSYNRLKVLTEVTDGFRIAEEDLKIRGPGEFFGTRQHGVPGLKIANPVTDQRLVEACQGHVRRLIDEDPHLARTSSRPCLQHLQTLSIDHTALAIG